MVTRDRIAAMKINFLLILVVVLLGFSHMNSLNAIPLTRTIAIMHEVQGFKDSKNTLINLEPEKKMIDVEETSMIRRMDVELHDYPGSGANNRHNPKPQLGRGCFDC
ncbi:uncharacterized protein LOC124917991 [Impatiens glandulifera]|uniref:uncharacterized protein LOC124917991 n=1 Tax=Impatiens glandulifera TaxID=253017 RepID=UPI001FB0B713|nr:uncharacterized protein LOC124917991 [Impatiens glandulifera]